MQANKQISAHAHVAKLCKEFCKSIGVKCSAKSDSYSMGNSVRVYVENQPPEIIKKLNDELSQYQYGHFDGMTDMYECTNRNDNIPQIKYLFIENRFDDSMKDAAWEYIHAHFDDAAQYSAIRSEVPSNADVWGRWADQVIYQLLNGSLSDTACMEFWGRFKVSNVVPIRQPVESVESVTIRQGTKEGYSELLFPSKPSQQVIDELKACGFRWSKFNSLWYGLTANIPACITPGERPEPTDPTKPSTTPGKGNKFRGFATAMQSKIDACFSDRQENTAKRMAQAASSRLEGAKLERTQKVLFALADMHDSGNVPAILVQVNTKADIYDRMAETVTQRPNGFHSYYLGEGKPRNQEALTLALWGLLDAKTPEQIKAEELAEKVRNLKFCNIPGYFPTPKAIIQKMISFANIQDGDKILDPNLGHGAILDVVLESFPNCDAKGYEVNYSLADICELKGYLLDRTDFLQVEPSPVIDAVLMNPPFENRQDCLHVMHAYKFLKPGAVLVSVMSNGWRFANDSKSQAFREFFDTHGTHCEDVEAGAFKESGANIPTCLVVITKN